MSPLEKLAVIERIARRYNTPGVNLLAQRLAADILEIIDERPRPVAPVFEELMRPSTDPLPGEDH